MAKGRYCVFPSPGVHYVKTARVQVCSWKEYFLREARGDCAVRASGPQKIFLSPALHLDTKAGRGRLEKGIRYQCTEGNTPDDCLGIIDRDVRCCFLNSHRVSGQTTPNQQAVLAPTHIAHRADFTQNGTSGIGQFGQLCGTIAQTGAIAPQGRQVSQSLMRPHQIVSPIPPVFAVAIEVLQRVAANLRPEFSLQGAV